MMYGASLGTLNVYQKVGASLGKAIWSISGDQGRGRTWLRGQVTLNSTTQFNVSLWVSYAKPWSIHGVASHPKCIMPMCIVMDLQWVSMQTDLQLNAC